VTDQSSPSIGCSSCAAPLTYLGTRQSFKLDFAKSRSDAADFHPLGRRQRVKVENVNKITHGNSWQRLVPCVILILLGDISTCGECLQAHVLDSSDRNRKAYQDGCATRSNFPISQAPSLLTESACQGGARECET
jgi:hypothetical protein